MLTSVVTPVVFLKDHVTDNTTKWSSIQLQSNVPVAEGITFTEASAEITASKGEKEKCNSEDEAKFIKDTLTRESKAGENASKCEKHACKIWSLVGREREKKLPPDKFEMRQHRWSLVN